MMLSAACELPDSEPEADLDNWDLLIGAILAEAAALRGGDRAELAARVLAAGGYQSPENSEAANAAAQLALRLAAGLADAAV